MKENNYDFEYLTLLYFSKGSPNNGLPFNMDYNLFIAEKFN